MATKHFYYLCLIWITFLGGLFLIMLKRNLKNTLEAKGLVFVALGLFSFATIGFYKLFDPPIPSLLLSDIDRIFSVFTNIFFVAALPFFSKVFIKFRETFLLFRKTDQWVNSVFIFFAFLAALFAVIERNVVSEFGKNIIIAFDSVFSTITIGLVAYALYVSITGFLKDPLSKLFIGLTLILFPLSQILLPLTVLFPQQTQHYYFVSLIVLIVGITFFTFVSIAYYTLLSLEMKTNNSEELVAMKNNDLQICSLHLGFEKTKKVYFIEIEFIQGELRFNERIENRKILLPFSNWILFSVAKKLNVKLLHPDIALIKFRMVEYWNKDSETKINQEILFTNDLGLFEFNFDQHEIEIANLNELETKHIVVEAIQKTIDNFAVLFPESEKSLLDARVIFDKIYENNNQ